MHALEKQKMKFPSQIDDFHVHLRQDVLMKTVTPLLEKTSRVRLAYVMVISTMNNLNLLEA